MSKNQPVTFRELIDAIAVLHVINDSSSPRLESFSTILNKPSRARRKRWSKKGRTR